MVQQFDKILKQEKFRNPEVMGCAGAILQLLYEKELPFDKWQDALKLVLIWLGNYSDKT